MKIKKKRGRPKKIIIKTKSNKTYKDKCEDEPQEVVVPEELKDNQINIMQINFPDQATKDAAVAAQTEANVAEEVNAKAVYDKRVARGVSLLNDLQAATVGAVVPNAHISVVDANEIVNRVVTDVTQAAQVVSEMNARSIK